MTTEEILWSWGQISPRSQRRSGKPSNSGWKLPHAWKDKSRNNLPSRSVSEHPTPSQIPKFAPP
eukprot:4088181-Amphidinium_carterae.1